MNHPPFAQNSTNVVRYSVKGVFLESRGNGSKAVIRHETIPGCMEAMTMPFNVKRPDELNGLKPGDEIRFRLNVTDTQDWIDGIQLEARATLDWFHNGLALRMIETAESGPFAELMIELASARLRQYPMRPLCQKH